MTGLEKCAVALVALGCGLTLVPGRGARKEGEREGGEPGRTVRVGLVFDVGGRGDKSFNDAAYLGVSRTEKELGVVASYLEPAGSEDREAAMRLFAARGFDLVIGVGFIFSSDIEAVAASYPDVKFACVDYAPTKPTILPNVAGLAFREEEGSFLVGAVAGLLTKTKHTGFVGGMETPLIRKFDVGFETGVHATCPICTVHSAYAGSSPEAFKDPAKGKSLTVSQIESGADVVFHASGATGHGVFEAAKEAHIAAIGVDADQYDEMPGTVVTSMIKRVDVSVVDVVRSVVEGRFKSGMNVLGLAEGAVDYVHDGPHAERITPALRAEVERLRKDVETGTIRVPSR